MTSKPPITEDSEEIIIYPLTTQGMALFLEGFEAYRDYLTGFASEDTSMIQFELVRIQHVIDNLQHLPEKNKHTGVRMDGLGRCMYKAALEFLVKKIEADRKRLLKRNVPVEAAQSLDEKIISAKSTLEHHFKNVEASKFLMGEDPFADPKVNDRYSIENRDGVVILGDNNQLEGTKN